MNINLIDKGTSGVLLLEGRLDSSTAPDAEEIVMQMTEKYEELVLDLKDLAYLSSAGLRILKKAHVAMVKKGGKLIVRNANEMIMEVFEMTGFAGILNLE
ncbi:MAG: STAS domain-containing protein [Lachnospiraceae bacterium]|nr:STAS domain-containing protein [Lachnospiraceae bacterium]